MSASAISLAAIQRRTKPALLTYRKFPPMMILSAIAALLLLLYLLVALVKPELFP